MVLLALVRAGELMQREAVWLVLLVLLLVGVRDRQLKSAAHLCWIPASPALAACAQFPSAAAPALAGLCPVWGRHPGLQGMGMVRWLCCLDHTQEARRLLPLRPVSSARAAYAQPPFAAAPALSGLHSFWGRHLRLQVLGLVR